MRLTNSKHFEGLLQLATGAILALAIVVCCQTWREIPHNREREAARLAALTAHLEDDCDLSWEWYDRRVDAFKRQGLDPRQHLGLWDLNRPCDCDEFDRCCACAIRKELRYVDESEAIRMVMREKHPVDRTQGGCCPIWEMNFEDGSGYRYTMPFLPEHTDPVGTSFCPCGVVGVDCTCDPQLCQCDACPERDSRVGDTELE